MVDCLILDFYFCLSNDFTLHICHIEVMKAKDIKSLK